MALLCWPSVHSERLQEGQRCRFLLLRCCSAPSRSITPTPHRGNASLQSPRVIYCTGQETVLLTGARLKPDTILKPSESTNTSANTKTPPETNRHLIHSDSTLSERQYFLYNTNPSASTLTCKTQAPPTGHLSHTHKAC